MKTKILFFLPNLNGGGAERVTVNILRQLDLEKFDAILVCVHKVGTFLSLVPENILIIDLQATRTFFSILKLRKVILELSPDVIFSTLLHTHIAVDLAMTDLQNKPKTIYRSSSSPKLLLENNQLGFVLRKLLERAYNAADKILAQTPEMKIEIAQYHGTNSNKIDVFLNPIDANLIDLNIQNIQNPFNQGTINVVAAGRLVEEKGFDILIESFKTVINQNDKYRLFIIGGGTEKERKKHLELIDKFELGEYINLLGFQRNPYKFFYYSDVYVLSSRREGLPNTVLENLYLKKPIIATKCIPFMKVLIEDGKNGLLVDVEDVSSLAKAILDYKDIDTSSSIVDFSSEKLDDIFVKFTDNELM